MKILVALIAIGAIFWIIRILSDSKQTKTPEATVENRRMLACDHCGLHIPEDEAIIEGSHSYCCAQHQRLGPKQG